MSRKLPELFERIDLASIFCSCLRQSMIVGFILLILSAIALPLASENSRFIVTVFALVSVGLIVAGIILGIKSRDSKKT